MTSPARRSSRLQAKPRARKAGCCPKPSAIRDRSRSRSETVKFKKSVPFRAEWIRVALEVNWRRAEPRASLVARAADEMVVDQTGCLHEGIDDRRPAELE